ncbi:MAG: dehydratase [Chloroflexi bacterium]|nr:dehydratase [Chloroflexota bacterium]MBI4215828.1 dehydratase [Chloroflexota bacterium]
MAKQVYYEDVTEGMELPQLVKHPMPRQLVQWAGATGDYNEFHYNETFAKVRSNLPGIIVHGALVCQFVRQMVSDWVGDEGTLKKLNVSYRGMNFPEQDCICKGKVVKKQVQGDDHLVELEVWSENPKGEKTTPGTAVAILPSRAKK